MTTVWKAKAYDIQGDGERDVWGTREFLKAATLDAIEDTERDVPDSDVDRNGQYRPHA